MSAAKKVKKATTKPKCELKTQLCSGELMARYVGKQKGDPEFNACRACLVYLKLTKRVTQIPSSTEKPKKS